MNIRIYIVMKYFDVEYYEYLTKHPKRPEEVKPYRIVGTFTSKEEAQKRYDELMRYDDDGIGGHWFYTIEKI